MNRVTLVNLYGPNFDNPIFINNLILKLATVKGQCIVGGEFNLVLNPLLDHSSPKSASLSNAATVLNSGLKDMGIIDDWRSLNPNHRDFSFYSGTHNTYSRIDMFLLPRDMMPTVKDYSYLAANHSDHNALKFTCMINTPQPSSHRWRFRNYMLKDPEFHT